MNVSTMRNTALKTLARGMKAYQREHDTRDECFVNSFIYAQFARVFGFTKARILPVYVVRDMVDEGEHRLVVAIHMCVHLGGNVPDEVADVSAQYSDLNDAEYFRTWTVLTKAYPSFTQHTKMEWLNPCLPNEISSGKGALARFIEYEGDAKKLNHFLDENPGTDGIGTCPFRGGKRIHYYDNMMKHILPMMGIGFTMKTDGDMEEEEEEVPLAP
jgi:hypothetical protein